MLLQGCGGGGDQVVEIAAIGDAANPLRASPRLNSTAQLVRAATSEGLVAFDQQGRVIPALADRWIVTDDGQSYIFRLRDGTWLDGAPLTGENARAALIEAIARLRGTAMGLDLQVIREVRAMAGRVVEIRLVRPMPEMLQLLALPELGLLRRGRGDGPMLARRTKDHVALTSIPPGQRGLPDEPGWTERHRPLHLHTMEAARALAAFDKGDVAAVLGGRLEDLPRLDVAGLSRGAIRLDPVAGLLGLQIQHNDGLFADPANREAIAMAIDRGAIVKAFNVGGWIATTRLVTPGLEGDSGTVGERWGGLTLDQRRAEAARRIARWRAGHAVAPLRIALPIGPGSDQLFALLAADLGTVGLAAQQVGADAPADLRLLDVVARYPRTAWFLDQLSCAAVRGLCDSAADALTARALTDPDPVKRDDRLAEAEAALTRANTFVPLAAPLRWSLVGGNLSGFAANRWGIHPLMALAAVPK